MRTDGLPLRSAVASAMALGSGPPACSASANQRPNSTTGSESTSPSSKGWSASMRSNMNGAHVSWHGRSLVDVDLGSFPPQLQPLLRALASALRNREPAVRARVERLRAENPHLGPDQL